MSNIYAGSKVKVKGSIVICIEKLNTKPFINKKTINRKKEGKCLNLLYPIKSGFIRVDLKVSSFGKNTVFKKQLKAVL